jgi:hypothetical protein
MGLIPPWVTNLREHRQGINISDFWESGQDCRSSNCDVEQREREHGK